MTSLLVICMGINMNKNIKAPLSEEVVRSLEAGDYVYITGIIYTARDAAHKRLYDSILKGEEIPFDLTNNIVYYLGQIGRAHV